MGFDAFGLPAEQYALQTGIHPATSTENNIQRYHEQLSLLGFSFDWSREVRTCDPSYYKWTQWIFTKFFNHYYDQHEEKAKPIDQLVAHFEKFGNQNLKAANSYKKTFSASEWESFSKVEKAEILMEYRLAYRKVGYVNWCEALGTVLANDQVKDGLSERGGYPVVKKAMTQWYLRITAYAERLLNGLDNIDWSDSLKTIQSNWIGRSEGATVFFDIPTHDTKIEIYTTRPDTIFGATFMVLAPEHPLVEQITTPDKKDEILSYLKYVKSRSERDRLAEVKSVTGADTGAKAMNPLTNKEIPIWIAEYVLMDYGSGAIMAVPSDDERDQKFALKFGIEIIDVVDKTDYPGATLHDKVGKMINSGFITGMQVPDAISAVCDEVEKMNIGYKQVNYKMRDANFSRQRYWGEPFPILYDKDGLAEALPVEELPLQLPESEDFKPTQGGLSPLAKIKSWVNQREGYTRETDTMPAVAGSSWYFLRYMDPHNADSFAGGEAVNYWRDVDLYIGGAEHAVAHLMYARFWHKFLFDKGLVPTDEPFKKLINQGMIQGVIEFMYLQKDKENGYHRFLCARLAEKEPEVEFARIPIPVEFVKNYGSEDSYMDLASIDQFVRWSPDFKDAIFECSQGVYHNGLFTPHQTAKGSHLFTVSEVGKMSKSKYNVINPDDIVDKYGADCFRMYEMFLGPLENSKPWDTKGIDGVYKFIRRFWRLFYNEASALIVTQERPSSEELRTLHQTIKRIEDDIERYSFNTCVSNLMVAVNELKALKCHKAAILNPLVILTSPFAPHLAEELWHVLGNKGTVHKAGFPIYESKYVVIDEIKLPIAINGKRRAEAAFSTTATEAEIRDAAIKIEAIQRWIEGKEIRKIIVVPKRMVNIVVS
jgi:leucyl-tRNA synthetase